MGKQAWKRSEGCYDRTDGHALDEAKPHNLVVIIARASVCADNQREIRGILTSLALPNGGGSPLAFP